MSYSSSGFRFVTKYLLITILTFQLLVHLSSTEDSSSEDEETDDSETNETLYTCQTPTEFFIGYTEPNDTNQDPGSPESAEFDEISRVAQHRHFRPEKIGKEEKWPGGVVHYKFNPHYPIPDDKKFILRTAFQEFESKTCIKFQESYNATYPVVIQSWVTSNETHCGMATVCMRGSDQYAKFTTKCMNKTTFVHELGHTLCLTHEHLRPDRSEYVSFGKCGQKEGKDNSTFHLSIYDYASQMHYPCTCKGGGGKSKNKDWTSCGEQIPGNDGLSVMDADTINDLYNCQGCHRHRWRSISKITAKDIENMYSFGHVDEEGRSIYPCRAMHRGEVAVGMYTMETRSCLIPSRFDKRGVKVKEQAEVLTIPGGLSLDNGDEESEVALHQYQLVNYQTYKHKSELIRFAVPAGNGWAEHLKHFARSYIAFASLTWDVFEAAENKTQYEDSLPALESIGSAWDWENEINLGSVFTNGKRNVDTIFDFKVLVCK